METAKSASLRLEESLERFGSPLKPYLPALGRFFLVVTFYEDALRIIFQWSDQMNFFTAFRGFPWFLAALFLSSNVLVMLVCSTLALMRKYSEHAVAGLAMVIVSQAFGYGMWTSISFVFRNISLLGGLVLLLSESLSLKQKAQGMFPGLPDITKNETSTYLSLLGRVLLIFLFLSVAFGGGDDFGIVRLVFTLISLVVCVMVSIILVVVVIVVVDMKVYVKPYFLSLSFSYFLFHLSINVVL